MIQPNDQPITSELEDALDRELATGRAGRAASPRPVDPVAGAGAGAWGPTAPTPLSSSGTLAAQIATMHADAQSLIDTLKNMQDALAIIRRKLG